MLFSTLKALHNLSPAYLTDLPQTYTPSRSLRSSSAGRLAPPAINLGTMGARALSCCTRTLELPSHPHADSITEFKNAIKTHLVFLAYSL